MGIRETEYFGARETAADESRKKSDGQYHIDTTSHLCPMYFIQTVTLLIVADFPHVRPRDFLIYVSNLLCSISPISRSSARLMK